MPKVKISEFSSTPANNTDIDSINLAEGCAPSGINDAIRELMAQLKDFQTGAVGDSFNGPVGTTTAAAGAFTTLSASSTVTLSGGTANGVLYLNGSKVVTSGSALTFDGTNLGIGTSSPAYKLDVNGNAQIGNATAGTNRFLYINGVANKASGIAFQESGTNRWLIGNGAASENGNFEIYDATNGNNFILTRSGNLGLGVTPSAWNSVLKAVSVGRAGSNIFGQTSANLTGITANAIFDSSDWKYVTTDNASRYQQNGGVHSWYNAPSGTAGNTITFTQAMSLTADGTLLIGKTAADVSVAGFQYRADIDSLAVSTADSGIGCVYLTRTANTGAFVQFLYSTGLTSVGSITTDGSTTAYNTSSDYRLKNITGPITTSGAYIDSLNPVEGTWKADGSIFVGLIAHEVQEASRTQVATGTKDGAEMQAMDYSNSELIANLIAEVKSLRQRVATLEAK